MSRLSLLLFIAVMGCADSACGEEWNTPFVRIGQGGSPVVSTMRDEGIMVCWQTRPNNTTNQSDIVCQRFDQNLQPLTTAVVITDGVELGLNPDVGSDADGNAYVVWQSSPRYRGSTTQPDGVIKISKINPAGELIFDGVVVSADYARNPAIAVSPAGEAHIAWNRIVWIQVENTWTATRYPIEYAIVNTTGHIVREVREVLAPPLGHLNQKVDIALASNGEMAMTMRNSWDTFAGITLLRFRADGSQYYGDMIVQEPHADDANLQFGTGGQVLLAYASRRHNGDTSRILFGSLKALPLRYFGVLGTPLNRSFFAESPTMATNESNGKTCVAWSERAQEEKWLNSQIAISCGTPQQRCRHNTIRKRISDTGESYEQPSIVMGNRRWIIAFESWNGNPWEGGKSEVILSSGGTRQGCMSK